MIDFILGWSNEEVALCEQAFRGLADWEAFRTFCKRSGFNPDHVLEVVEATATEAERIGQQFHINVGN